GPDPVRPRPPLLLWVTAAVPMFALGLIATRAATTLFVSVEPRALWLAGVAALALAGGVLEVAYKVPSLPPRMTARTALSVAGVLALLAAGAAAVWPIAVGQQVGAVALLFLLAAVVALGLAALSLAGEAWTPAGALAMLGLRRVPVITLFAAWYLVTSVINHTDHYHDVRLGAPLPAQVQAEPVSAALDSWIGQRSLPVTGGRQQVPMLFVSASGGGIRAAYWTAMVLDCLFAAHPVQPECAADPLDRSAVFAESGISGGSLGLVFDRVMAGTGRGYPQLLDQDFVAPDAAALAFRDMPIGFLRLEPSGIDRAAVLEQAWERAAGSPSPLRAGLFADSRDAGGNLRFPLLLLSGAAVDDGCRLNNSVLAASTTVTMGPVRPAGADNCLSLTPFDPGRVPDTSAVDPSTLAGSEDLFDFLCTPGGSTRHDIALSTVALLSARFPYISPTGGLNSCGSPQRRTFDIDGGLLDSSGLSTLTELWARIGGNIQAINDNPGSPICIQPRLLMIDNGYLPATPTSAADQPQEMLAPIQGRSLAGSLSGARAEQAAALAFDHAFGSTSCAGAGNAPPPVSRVAHIVPTIHPGPRAPLGWSLSRFARNDLEAQLNSPANRCQIELVRSWFAATPTARTGFCLTGFAVRAQVPAPSGTPALATFGGPFDGTEGVAGVQVSIEGCTPTARTTCTASTDANGRFDLILTPGQARTLTVSWAGARLTGVPVPDATRFIDTSVSFLVTGKPGG
ncbi:MAG TPA: hypothetical protein VJT31_00310, partial [Rugosimonospora sp.]|nr:hypothetical protein [Rugosimonospora sp.]